MELLPLHLFCLAKQPVRTWNWHKPSLKCISCIIASHRVTNECEFLMWLLQQPLWSVVSPASQYSPFVLPLDKLPWRLPKPQSSGLNWPLTILALAQRPQSSLIKGVPRPAFLPAYTLYLLQDLWVINVSISFSFVVCSGTMAYHSAPCAPLNKQVF